MPFIRGRYHINPIAGQALEAAREAEEALATLQREQSNSDANDSTKDSNVGEEKGPIHRVEIEAAEVVPSHSGRAHRGFVARVHRTTMQPQTRLGRDLRIWFAIADKRARLTEAGNARVLQSGRPRRFPAE